MMQGIFDQLKRLTGARGGASLRRAPAVDLSALLPRPPRKIDLRAARKMVAGKSVLVTGAGGTIGSELCRQIVACEPAHLTLVDNAEFALYQIDLELKEAGHGGVITSDLTDVCRMEHLKRVFAKADPDIVLHAAAFKHVPIVEENRCAGALTNVLGAKNVFDAAIDHDAESVVFISTDKAVNPTSFMGATKRIAELYAQALDVAQNDTRFVTVRFGNVLGSSGSVVTLFAEQIDNGGPVTVTHPEVTRYFMSIPEAAELVLQAASMAQGGDIFLLDMVEPVRILDLAHCMIGLKGFAVASNAPHDGEISIEITGLKPGEKMHEELLETGNVTGTDHPKIMRAEENYLPWRELRGALNTLEQACDTFDYAAIKTFIEGLVEGASLESQLGDLSPRAEIVHLPKAE